MTRRVGRTRVAARPFQAGEADERAAAITLWPADQLLITADTSESINAILHPHAQLNFLQEMSSFAGPGLFAESLVYSTSRGNTGWTAFRLGAEGHITFHHWDMPRPNLLQLDVYGSDTIDEAHALATVTTFWLPTGMRVIHLHRNHPAEPFSSRKLRDDVQLRPGASNGFGPGDHLHLLIDQTSDGFCGQPDQRSLDAALAELVGRLKMRCMTPVISSQQAIGNGGRYDGIVGITTSHVALRVLWQSVITSVSLDIFSCRNFTPGIVFRWLDSLFACPQHRRSLLYNRHPHGDFTVL